MLIRIFADMKDFTQLQMWLAFIMMFGIGILTDVIISYSKQKIKDDV
jgi:hypothetical protein